MRSAVARSAGNAGKRPRRDCAQEPLVLLPASPRSAFARALTIFANHSERSPEERMGQITWQSFTRPIKRWLLTPR
jgi:hypothetical protein